MTNEDKGNEDKSRQEQREQPKPPPPNPGKSIKHGEPPHVRTNGSGQLTEGGGNGD